MEEKNSEKKERKMRNSGIPWIGEVPEGWEFSKIKYHCTMKSGDNITALDISDNGEYPVYGGNGLRGFYKIYNKNGNHILIGRQGALAGNVHLVNGKFWATDHAVVATLKNDVFINYFFRMLESMNLNQYAFDTAAQPGLSVSRIMNLNIVLPNLEEQHRIADFLDSKCSEIDTLIENLRARVESAKEYKKAVITEAVTKGLDKDAKMKDSGVEWIGKVPEKWKLVPFKYLLNERNEKNYPIKSDERLSLSIDKGITLYSEKTTNLDRFKDDVSQYKLAYCGDFVMNSMNMIVGAVGVSKYFGCVSPAYYVFFDDEPDNCYCKYCDYLFHTSTLKRILFSLGKGIMAIDRGNGNVNTCRLKVSRYDLGALKLPIPPREELQSILSYLDSKCSEIDALLQNYEDQIKTLEEYKKSLIYEYVTGKKEVPAA